MSAADFCLWSENDSIKEWRYLISLPIKVTAKRLKKKQGTLLEFNFYFSVFNEVNFIDM